MFDELWESEMRHHTSPVNDVQVSLFVRYGDQPRVMYKVRVYREEKSKRIRLLDVAYPHGIPIYKLPRGAKRELRRVFPLAAVMLAPT